MKQKVGNTISQRYFIVGGRTSKGRIFLGDVNDIDNFFYVVYPSQAKKFLTEDKLYNFLINNKSRIRSDVRSVYILKVSYDVYVDEYNPEYSKGE